MTDLSTLGGNASFATGINDSGQVVGYSYTAGDSELRAFLYTNGKMIELPTLGGDYSYGQGYGINDSGQVVGDSIPAGDSQPHAFLYTNGQIIDLHTFGGYNSTAYGINDSGQAVGESETAGGSYVAFLYTNGQLTDLGTLGGDFSSALDINDSGQVVGYSYTAGDSETHAFLYTNGQLTDLGTFGGGSSSADSINDSGQVVGYSDTASGAEDAFLYSKNTGMVDLNTLLPANSGWRLTEATAINNQGQIVGAGINPAGATHAFLLNLSEPQITATSLEWDANDDGVDYGYTISGADLPQPTTVALDWASGMTVDTAIGDPIDSEPTQTAQGTYSVDVPGSAFGPPPPNAKYLIAVADPNNTIAQENGVSNVQALALPDITVTQPTWNTQDGGVDFGYTISGNTLPQPTTAVLYWSPVPTFDPTNTAQYTLAYSTSTQTRRVRRPTRSTSSPPI